jgi:hypothetical protein
LDGIGITRPQGFQQNIRPVAPVAVKMKHLSPGMDATIGPPGTMDCHPLFENNTEPVLNEILYGFASGL